MWVKWGWKAEEDKCLLIYRLQNSSDREIIFKFDGDLLISKRFEHGENKLASLVSVEDVESISWTYHRGPSLLERLLCKGNSYIVCICCTVALRVSNVVIAPRGIYFCSIGIEVIEALHNSKNSLLTRRKSFHQVNMAHKTLQEEIKYAFAFRSLASWGKTEMDDQITSLGELPMTYFELFAL